MDLGLTLHIVYVTYLLQEPSLFDVLSLSRLLLYYGTQYCPTSFDHVDTFKRHLNTKSYTQP